MSGSGWYGHWVDEESMPSPVDVYEEVDADGYVLRQVFVDDDQIVATNRDHADFRLSEAVVSVNDYADYSGGLISADDFAALWQQACEPSTAAWRSVTSTVKIGQVLDCRIHCFYPQGAILDLGMDFWGLADYDKTCEIVGTNRCYPGTAVRCIVGGFGDEDQWLLLTPV